MKAKSYQPNIFLSSTAIYLVMIVFLSACHRTSSVITFCDTVTGATTWSNHRDGVDYIISCPISVEALLTIEPGTEIEFASGAGIIVSNTGSIKAVGTFSQKISMHGSTDVAGSWKGIFLNTSSLNNKFDFCTISGGGQSSFDGHTDWKANLRVALSARVELTNCDISKSGKDGVYVEGFDSDEQNSITSFSNNTFTGNLNYPLSILGATVNELDASSVYIGNTIDKVLVRGGRLFGAHVWKKLGVHYLVQDILSVGYYADNGNLTVNPGVTIEFAGGAGLCTGDYSTGSWMKLNGSSPPNVITLTGETALAGWWKGIAFQSTSPNNQISYTIIEYGGHSSYTGNTAQRGNIMAGAWSAGSFSIENSNITNSAAYGVYATLAPSIFLPVSMFYQNNVSGNYYHE